jgi:hypothetical protein
MGEGPNTSCATKPLTPPLPQVQGRGVVFLVLCTFLEVPGGQPEMLGEGRGEGKKAEGTGHRANA